MIPCMPGNLRGRQRRAIAKNTPRLGPSRSGFFFEATPGLDERAAPPIWRRWAGWPCSFLWRCANYGANDSMSANPAPKFPYEGADNRQPQARQVDIASEPSAPKTRIRGSGRPEHRRSTSSSEQGKTDSGQSFLRAVTDAVNVANAAVPARGGPGGRGPRA